MANYTIILWKEGSRASWIINYVCLFNLRFNLEFCCVSLAAVGALGERGDNNDSTVRSAGHPQKGYNPDREVIWNVLIRWGCRVVLRHRSDFILNNKWKQARPYSGVSTLIRARVPKYLDGSSTNPKKDFWQPEIKSKSSTPKIASTTARHMLQWRMCHNSAESNAALVARVKGCRATFPTSEMWWTREPMSDNIKMLALSVVKHYEAFLRITRTRVNEGERCSSPPRQQGGISIEVSHWTVIATKPIACWAIDNVRSKEGREQESMKCVSPLSEKTRRASSHQAQ
ncbi:hypothetical protein BDR05DRAFT_946182 [Suillus weaverae]|nr:hypothetical protein BDR05DRAFT_946182 [Suillus weaverae]